MRRYKIILCFLVFNFLCATASFALIDNWTHYNNGIKFLAAKNYAQAQGNFDYYLNQPEMHRHMFGVAHFGRGLLFQEMGKYDRAIEEFRLAIENDLHPTVRITDNAYMNIGTIYMERKAYQDAIRAYSKAIEGNSRNGLAHYYLGLVYLKDNQYEEAEKEAEEAKRLGVTFTALSDELNKIKNNTGKTGKAQKRD
ncbi:MAG: tetratricopeptide repeat protein [Nitrospirae bacterium]|nr:tetratricopeptide repeat protein [Nitrospirota bacterium]